MSLISHCFLTRLYSFLSKIVNAQNSGGLSCLVGKNDTILRMLLYPAVPFIVTDNKEAHSMAMIKMIGTNRPCRFCVTERGDLHKFNGTEPCDPRIYKEIATEHISPEIMRTMSYQQDIKNVTKHKNVKFTY